MTDERVYKQRQRTMALRRAVYLADDRDLLDSLVDAEEALSSLEAEAPDDLGGVIADDTSRNLQIKAVLRMAQLPTSIYHLFDCDSQPLVSCTVRNPGPKHRRVLISSYLEGYSATASGTYDLPPGAEVTVDQLPTLFPWRVREVTELTVATVTVVVTDVDDGGLELQRSLPVRLLACSAVPFAVRDPATGTWNDLSRYLGAFVTPNAPKVMRFLRQVADHHEKKHLVGYQIDEAEVESQVRAIFDALRAAGIAYINSVVAFGPEHGTVTQRVRLPRESLDDREANCIDGTVLVASLIEALTMNPALIVVPGHSFVGWETWDGSGEWRYLETTLIGSTKTFEEACDYAAKTAQKYEDLVKRTGDTTKMHRWPLRALRTEHGITPVE